MFRKVPKLNPIPHVLSPHYARSKITCRQLLLLVFLSLLLFSNILVAWATTIRAASTAAQLPSPTASMTFQQFLKEGRKDRFYRGPFVPLHSSPLIPKSTHTHSTDYTHLPPSAEPAKMQPLSHALDSSLMVGSTGGTPLDLVGSDKRLEIVVQPGSLDLSHAAIAGGTAPSGTLTLQLTQLHGHFAGFLNLLGAYQFQIVDSQGHTVNDIRLRTPVTFIYHYQPAELTSLDLDPDHLLMSWPTLIVAAQKAKQPTTGLVIPLHNDPKAHTLTAQSTVLGPGPLDMGGGDPQNQSPAIPHLASVQGNAGQVTYTYPLQVPLGTGGFAPNFSLNYSSSDPNERHSPTSSANNVGDGWSLNLGSITADVYPNSQTWYFLHGVANAADRLIPNGSFFDTEHISHLRIQQVTSTQTNQPCFNIWDTSGTFYELGCTTDSLQYHTDVNGQHNYRWDVDKIVAPNEGPSSAAYRLILVSYLQDSVSSGGYTSIRDAAIKQITYGYGTSTSSLANTAGTVDFSYLAPFTSTPWATAYGTNYNCSSPPPASTTLRCDDPIALGSVQPPTVISTLTLQTVTSYVGTDGPMSYAYRYSFSYTDTPFYTCYDPYTLIQQYCAGEHLLTSVTPTVYQYVYPNNTSTPHQLKSVTFGYTSPLQNTYYDSQHLTQNGSQQYSGQTFWQYLNAYQDTNTGVGEHITYARAYSNTNGTPNVMNGNTIVDDRYDALYCTNHPSDCTGNYAHPDDHAWSEQVVTQIQSWGKDSSSSSLQPATTTYSYYRLAKTGTYGGSGTFCYPAGTDSDCLGDNWLPSGDGDWQDYYHAEYRGFNQVYVISPANNLSVNSYFSTEGWNTPGSDAPNYNGGQLYEQDIYNGSSVSSTALLSTTTNNYSGMNSTATSCRSSGAAYDACEVVVLSSRTTQYEGTTGTVPWVESDYTYDDYDSVNGFNPGPYYHNLLIEIVSSSNAPTLTKKWSYTPNDQIVVGWVYYTVNKVTHSEVDDANGHVWQCQDMTYDEGAPRTPSAGWLTTDKTYSDCTNQNGTVITNYLGYNNYGNLVVSVDGEATGNSTLYSSNGCTQSPSPVFFSQGWSSTRYTTCTSYDTSFAQPFSMSNALSQSSNISYDYGQGALPTSVTDVNGQVTYTSYSYDSNSGSNGKRTIGISQPTEPGSYTSQSSTYSSCTGSSTLPCYEIDSNLSQYPNAVQRTFYDSLGRAVETRTPGPGSGYDTIVITTYNDQANTVWQSVPFEVTSGSGWVDPNGAVDYQGVAPGGTVTFYDALGRAIATQDPLYNSGNGDGISCSAYLFGTFTACVNYGLGSAPNDSAVYAYADNIDPNNHEERSFADALGRTRYIQWYTNGPGGGVNEQRQIQYNALDEPTAIITTDLLPRSGESATSVTTSMTYDDLGRLTILNDPDRGTHNYSYGADGRLLSDVSGTRTLGYNYDLLGRLGCVQDATPTINANGACSAGHPYVQNTYDTTFIGTKGTTDFPVGRLTQTIATTYYPEGTSATVTEQMQHDQRGRLTNENLQIGVPSSWNVTMALPTYQMANSYNDANQLTTSVLSTNPAGQSSTTTQVYDTTTGVLTGLSNNGNPTADLATITYNARAQLSAINLQTTTGSALATDQFSYDANLRPTTMSATWQSGSGSSGTILSQSRSYDPAGNVISLSTTQAAVPGHSGSGGSETENFCYDEQNRLVWAGNSGTQPPAGTGTCGSGTLSNTLSGGSYSSSFLSNTWANSGKVRWVEAIPNTSTSTVTTATPTS